MVEKRQVQASKAKEPRRKLYRAPALEKGLDIVELLARESEGINLKEIADRLGRSVGEIFRMLAVLEQRGFVKTSPGSDRFQLTMRLFQLAHWHLPVNRLTSAAAGPMKRLTLKTGQSCHLTMLSGSRIVVVAKHDSYSDRSFSMRVGAESPIFASCSGRIFFALGDDFMRETLLSTIREDGGDTSMAEASMKLAPKIQKSGFLEVASDHIGGITDIGTPIYGHDGLIAAALVVPFLHRLDKNDSVLLTQARAALIEAGKDISAALGAN